MRQKKYYVTLYKKVFNTFGDKPLVYDTFLEVTDAVNLLNKHAKAKDEPYDFFITGMDLTWNKGE